jgi:hypothetical protein
MSDLIKRRARVLAYYLPQFHPVPENNMWWGQGFTEWNNVASAKPLFRGHDQPRIPADLGFYDLRIPEVRQAQAAMAEEAGIEGFLYWNYWFGNGRKILEMPLNELLKTGKPNFPFCLGWANHSWSSKSWNKVKSLRKSQLLIEQLYPGEKDNENHFFAYLNAFHDKRYVQIDNKPAFLIYDPLAIPNLSLFIEQWNNLAIKNGLNGIHFIGMNNGWSSGIDKLLKAGFDSVNRNGQWEAECKVNGSFTRKIKNKLSEKLNISVIDAYEFSKIIKHYYNEYDSKENVIPTIIPQWDRSPRAGKKGVLYTNSSPKLFSEHIEQALQIVSNKKAESRILILKSWNEWGEGNYVEPDKSNGHGYLEVLKNKILS